MGIFTSKKGLLILLLSSLCLSSLVFADSREEQQQHEKLREARQCRLKQLSASRPSQRIKSEGGVTELWDEFQDQFQCAGLAAFKNTVRPKALSLPHYSISSELVYVQKGQGLVGISIPGCPETYNDGQQYQREQQQEQRRPQGDRHQKVHRFRKGDIIAIPSGAVHWCYNDGNEDVVVVSVSDLNNPANQLDQKLRLLFLAGEQPKESQPGQGQQQQQQGQTLQNVVRLLDESLMADTYNIPLELAKKIQENKDRGFIVNVKEGDMSVIRPDEEEARPRDNREGARSRNELQWCHAKIRHNLDKPSEADVYNRKAGRLNIADDSKLPILRYLDLSAQKGILKPDAIHALHYKANAHSSVYITRGDGRIQVVDDQGKIVFNDNVKEGDMLVIPQFYPSVKKAGNNGLEWVSFQTSSAPLEYSLAGATSALKAMPLEVLTNSYQISFKEARDLKYNREDEVKLVAPKPSSSY